MINSRGLFLTSFALFSLTFMSLQVFGFESDPGDLLIKFKPGHMPMQSFSALTEDGGGAESLGDGWVHVMVGSTTMMSTSTETIMETLSQDPDVEYVQPNYRISFIEDYETHDSGLRRALEMVARGISVPGLDSGKLLEGMGNTFGSAGSNFASWFITGPKPSAPTSFAEGHGGDPYLKDQWGMKSINAPEAWKTQKGNKNVIVAVIDSGVDYTHGDLAQNIWHNPHEIADNKLDDDGNGYIDDVIGWDFAENDNKPFDVSTNLLTTLLFGGNPGHGTHCAGDIAAVSDNGIGISGVAPNVTIMPLRFIGNKGQGTTVAAVKAIYYAVNNGAKILSNSWGSEGEDPKEKKQNQALRDAITYAENHDVLFVTAAGNGHSGVGYNNDTDKKPAYPASYPMSNIISVAAVDVKDKLGSFSNFGKTSVQIAAPGVKIMSTMVRNRYSSVVFGWDNFPIIPWEGTSMAAPYVAGAAALIWSAHPELHALDIKKRIMDTARQVLELHDKISSGGIVDVAAAIR